MAIEKKIYYVAISYGSYGLPNIVEFFYYKSEAQAYAELMRRSKHREYIILEGTEAQSEK